MIYYGLISLATLLGALWFLRRAADLKLSRVIAADIAIITLIAGFVGARLLHVFFEEPEFYREQPLRVLEFWRGGFVYFGGLAGALLATAFYCDWRREPFWVWADVAAPAAALAYGLGRLGCFLNGCCYGRHCELPWAVYMQGDHRHPTQLYASLSAGLTAWLLVLLEPRLKKPGSVFGLWLVLHGLGRLLMESFRDDPRGPLLAGLSLGTWLSAALIAGGLVLLAGRLVPRLQSH